MKKFAAVLLIVMLFSGTALAFHGNRHHDSMFAPDMPKEIREKVTEIAKLNIDLDEALTSHPLNKAKAREVYGKILKLQQELDVWEFEKYLNDVEDFNRHPESPDTEAE